MKIKVRVSKQCKVKESEDKPHSLKKAYGEFHNVFLSDDEYNLLIEKFGNPEQLIERLDRYKEKSGNTV